MEKRTEFCYLSVETWIEILKENGIDPDIFGSEDEEENE